MTLTSYTEDILVQQTAAEAVEHIGSGIKRIRGLCREYGVAEPRIEVSEHWFTVSFPRPEMQRGGKPSESVIQIQVTAEAGQLGATSGPSLSQVCPK